MNSKIALAASSFGSLGSNKTYARFNIERVRIMGILSTFKRLISPTFLTYLIVLVEPEKGEISDTYWFPVVLDLLACTVDDVRHFVRYDKFQVLEHTKSSQV